MWIGENGFSAAEVGAVDEHLAIEAPRAEEGLVEDLGAVGGRHDDDAACGLESVHLDEELVERLFALVVGGEGRNASRGSCRWRRARR